VQLESDEISLREIIEKITRIFYELLSKWWLFLLVCLPLGAAMGYYAYSSNEEYNASLVFAVNEDDGGSLGGLGSIASSFGLNIGGGGSVNLMKVEALAKAKEVTEKGLFEKVTIEGKEDYIANHIIDYFNFHEDWNKDDEEYDWGDLKDFRFDREDIASFSLKESAALNRVNYQLHGIPSDVPSDIIFSTSLDEDTGLVTFNAVTENEKLSLSIVNAIYSELSKYYVEKAIEPQKMTYNTLKIKADSILNELHKAEYSLANFSDSFRGLQNRTSTLDKQRYQRAVQINTLVYGEALKNLEIADFALKNARPVFQIIGGTYPPIEPKVKSILLYSVLGIFIGGIVAFFWIIGRMIYLDAMKDSE